MTRWRSQCSAVVAVCLGVAACGSGDDGPQNGRGGNGEGGAGGDGAGATTQATTGGGPSSNGSDAGSMSGGSAAGGSGSGGSGSGAAVCEPGIACGGLEYCSDDCYGSECCVLVCNCIAETDTLECALYC